MPQAHTTRIAVAKGLRRLAQIFQINLNGFIFPLKIAKQHITLLDMAAVARVLKEPIYGVAIKNGKCYIVDECEDLYEIGKTVFLTKEKAKKEVDQRKNQ